MYFSMAIGILILHAQLPALCSDPAAKNAIAAHAATLSRIHSLYLKVGNNQNAFISETWRQGARGQIIERDLSAKVNFRSWSEEEMRTMDGWDPAAPLPLPLNADTQDDVHCSIHRRQPGDLKVPDW